MLNEVLHLTNGAPFAQDNEKDITNELKTSCHGCKYDDCEVENGNNDNCVGDALWFSKDGTECEICDDILERVELSELSEIFDNESVLKIIKKFG